ncbi:MAG: MATE family efflux transporter [Lachnospiraceae bacterium]|nr:MATE family efflux transporter [Lachnospiraceae bacterium]
MTSFFKKLFINDREFYKKVLMLATPIALQSMISIGVNMLDTIMLGKLGETQLSASSLANSFISIYHIFCMGIGMGASVLISRYWGMKAESPEVADVSLKKTIAIMLKITVSLATLFALVTLFAPALIMSMYTVETEIIESGIIYLRYSVITFFFLGLSLVCTLALRSVGQVRLPLLVSVGAFFVNLFFNYGLIFGKFGMPEMGIAGAALGTLIARIYETAVICGYLLFFDKKIGFRVKHILIKTSDLIGEYFRICIPVLISDGILAIGNNVVAIVIGHLGHTFIAANAITAVTQQMSTVVIQGVSQAGAIVTGQTLGEGDKEKTMAQGYAFLGLGAILGLIAALCVIIISPFIIKSYNVTDETARVAKQLMNAISIILLFQAINSIMTKGVLRGGGDTKMLMLADNIFLWILSIPMGIVAGFLLHSSAFAIYVCLKFDQVAKTVWCVIRLESGKWIKKIKAASVDTADSNC